MGWDTTYNAGPTKARMIEGWEGDPLGCNVCSYHAASHPRQSGREYDSIYGPRPESEYPAPHEFVPHVQKFKVIDYSQVGWNVVYMAVQQLTPSPYGKVGQVFATVSLIRRDRDGSLTKKDMSETSGTGLHTCPLRLLDKLSPVDELYGPILFRNVCDNHYDCSWADAESKPHVNQRQVPDGSAASATEWRAKTRAYHAKAKPKEGDVVKFGAPINFRSGASIDTLTFVKGSTFREPGGSRYASRYLVTGWKEMAYEIVGKEAA